MNCNSSSDMEMATDPFRPKGKVGYRFHPYDHELVGHFLTKKRNRLSDGDDTVVREVEIYDKEPWDLPGLSPNRWGDLAWYFYCKPVRKYKNSRRSSRTTKAGYWKSTGKPRIVWDKKSKTRIGTKKTLVFHEGRPKGISTEWVMHEYECSSNPKTPFKDDYVLYKLKKKPNNKTAKEEPKGCLAETRDSQNQILNEMTPDSACGESELTYQVASNFEIQDREEINASSTSSTKNFEFEHQNPDETIAISALKGGATSHAVISDVENQISVSDLGAWDPSNMILFYEEGEPAGLMLSDFDNPISFPTEDGWSLPPATPSDFQNQSAGLMLCDLKNENIRPLKKQSDISAYEEGEQATQVVLPSNVCLQNQYLNSDGSTFEVGHQGPLMAPSFQNQWSYEIIDFGNDKANHISDGQGPSMTLAPEFGFNSESGAATVDEVFWSSLLEMPGSDSISGDMPN